jgi:hypothetical protein
MAYAKTLWNARQAANPNRFIKSQETANSVVLVNEPDSIIEHGTPFTPENMNHIEEGILQAHNRIAGEAQAREAAVSAEAQARQQGDNNLAQAISAEAQARQAEVSAEARARQQAVAAMLARQEEFQFISEYFRQFIEFKLGSISRTIPLMVEGGYYLVTENDDYLVAA